MNLTFTLPFTFINDLLLYNSNVELETCKSTWAPLHKLNVNLGLFNQQQTHKAHRKSYWYPIFPYFKYHFLIISHYYTQTKLHYPTNPCYGAQNLATSIEEVIFAYYN